MLFGLFARGPPLCAACGTEVGAGALQVEEDWFHSTLCLRRFEKEQARVRRERRQRERNALRACPTCRG